MVCVGFLATSQSRGDSPSYPFISHFYSSGRGASRMLILTVTQPGPTSLPALCLMVESRHLGALLTSWKILAAQPQSTHLPISREAHRGERYEASYYP